jgi:hypothetical protein
LKETNEDDKGRGNEDKEEGGSYQEEEEGRRRTNVKARMKKVTKITATMPIKRQKGLN